MIKIIIYVLFLHGCSIDIRSSDVILEEWVDRCKFQRTEDSFWTLSRKRCIRLLNDNYNYRYYRPYLLEKCEEISFHRWKSSWQKLDQQITTKTKANNEPLPENFKTAEEIFAEYPNPCQDNQTFWKQVEEYEQKQKTK